MGHRAIKVLEEDYVYISYFSVPSYWDICAPDAILRELGGGLRCFKDNSYNYELTNSELSGTVKENFIFAKTKQELDFTNIIINSNGV
jgi:3'-phosphoadenosine 5'-phosphosulfate (PAPS) 3'-phosphatase